MIVHLAIRHCDTEPFVEDMISFVNVLFGETVLDISYHIFKNLFPPSKCITRHYFCPDCEIPIGSSEEMKGVKLKKCHKCHKNVNVGSVDCGNYFITLSLREQIEAFLARPDVKLVDHKRRTSDFISDIFDGEMYKTIRNVLGQQISNILTYTFNTDGVRVHKSTKNSMWPILLYINEVIPDQRFQVDNVILAGVWFGTSAPNMALFMKPFLVQALDLAKNGVRLIKPNGAVEIFHVFPLDCSLDSVAKAKVLCQKQFNGEFGCLYCTHPNNATVEGSCHQKFYDTSTSYPLRTEEQVITDMNEADNREREGTLKNDSVNGFLGLSVLLTLSGLLKDFPMNTYHIVWSTVIDYLHNVLEGITSDLLEMYLLLLDGVGLDRLNERLQNISPPKAMTRKPRPLSGKSEKIYWKAKEYRSFLLYYCLPCLEDLLPVKHFNLLKLLVNAMHILLSDNITARAYSEAKSALSQFVAGFQKLYGLSRVTYNLHLLSHLCDLVYKMGPLWSYSNFVFESCNGRLVKLIRGTRSIINEIAVKYTKIQNIPSAISRNPISSAALEFCNNVFGFKYLKSGTEVGEMFVTGSFSLVDIDDQESSILKASDITVIDNQVKFYNRVIRNGIVYCSKSYTKARVYNDSCVILADGRYAFIDKILITAAGKLVCLIIPIRTSGNIIPPIVRCTQDCFAPFQIVPFDSVSRKCVFISVADNKRFICNIPNFYERD